MTGADSRHATDTTVMSSGNTTGARLPDRTNQTSSTSTYENYGIRLQYPSDWKQQQNLRPVLDILFIPPGENESLPRTGVGFKTVNIPSTFFNFNQDPDTTYTAIEEMGPMVTQKYYSRLFIDWVRKNYSCRNASI